MDTVGKNASVHELFVIEMRCQPCSALYRGCASHLFTGGLDSVLLNKLFVISLKLELEKQTRLWYNRNRK